MKEFCVGAKITDQKVMANVMLSSLHDEVHTPMMDMNYPPEVYEDPVALATVLTINYGDHRTSAEHGVEFRAMKQTDKESATEFF